MKDMIWTHKARGMKSEERVTLYVGNEKDARYIRCDLPSPEIAISRDPLAISKFGTAGRTL